MTIVRRRRTRSSTRKSTAKASAAAVARGASIQVETRHKLTPGMCFPAYHRGAPEGFISESKLSLAKMAASLSFQAGEASAKAAFTSYGARKYQ